MCLLQLNMVRLNSRILFWEKEPPSSVCWQFLWCRFWYLTIPQCNRVEYCCIMFKVLNSDTHNMQGNNHNSEWSILISLNKKTVSGHRHQHWTRLFHSWIYQNGDRNPRDRYCIFKHGCINAKLSEQLDIMVGKGICWMFWIGSTYSSSDNSDNLSGKKGLKKSFKPSFGLETQLNYRRNRY